MGNQYEKISIEICAFQLIQRTEVSCCHGPEMKWRILQDTVKTVTDVYFFLMTMKKMLGSYCVLENILDAMSWLGRLL